MNEEPAAGRIVVGVDGSGPSRSALAWAVRQAEQAHATVEAITAWHIPGAYGLAVPPGDADWEADAGHVLKDTLAEVTGSTTAQILPVVTQGNPAGVLIDASRGAALLVVGCRGHGGFAGLLLGSVSAQCVHHAHCPVVVIRGEPAAC